jgi:hypothetical protein
MGILVEGTGNVVRNNQVVSTGGSTGEIAAWGINTAGPGARVINNDVTGTAAQSNGTSAGIAVVVEDNRVSDTSSPSGTSIGIYILSPSSNVMVVDNRIATADTGVLYSGSTGKYRDNITDGVTTDYSGGTPIGTNN